MKINNSFLLNQRKTACFPDHVFSSNIIENQLEKVVWATLPRVGLILASKLFFCSAAEVYPSQPLYTSSYRSNTVLLN